MVIIRCIKVFAFPTEVRLSTRNDPGNNHASSGSSLLSPCSLLTVKMDIDQGDWQRTRAISVQIDPS